MAAGRMGLVVYIVYMGGEGGSCRELLKKDSSDWSMGNFKVTAGTYFVGCFWVAS